MTIFIVMIAWITGIIWGLYLNISIAYFIVAITILYIVIIKSKKIKKYFKVLRIRKILLIFIIFITCSYINIKLLENDYKNRYEDVNGEIKLIATVISNVQEKEYKDIYTIKVESINGNKKYSGTRLILNIKKKDNFEIKYGDKIELIGEYKTPSIQRNYRGFNYKQYLKTKKIYGNIESKKVKVIKHNNINLIYKTINNISISINNKINQILDKEESGVLSSILIGNKNNLQEDIKESFRDSNLSHMLAISGAHISYIILGITVILSKIKIHKKISKIFTILFLIFFIILTKSTPSVVRACIMGIYIIFSTLINRKPNTFASISISMLILLIYNPYNILDIGLQLSFGGTIGIVLFYNLIKRKFKSLEYIKSNFLNKLITTIKEIIFVTISANIVIIPIMILNFNTISYTFLISNLLASPILGVIIILGFITIIISFISTIIAFPFTYILHIFLKLLILISKFSSNLPFSKNYVKTPYIITIFLYYTFLIFILIYIKITKKTRKRKFEKSILKKITNLKISIRRNIKKYIGIVICIILIFQLIKIIPQDLKMYFIDVGQGDSMFIITPTQKSILIDGGGSRDNSTFDVGKSTLLPYLLNRRIDKIDYCLISHFDSDHCVRIANNNERIKSKKCNNWETI